MKDDEFVDQLQYFYWDVFRTFGTKCWHSAYCAVVWVWVLHRHDLYAFVAVTRDYRALAFCNKEFVGRSDFFPENHKHVINLALCMRAAWIK